MLLSSQLQDALAARPRLIAPVLVLPLFFDLPNTLLEIVPLNPLWQPPILNNESLHLVQVCGAASGGGGRRGEVVDDRRELCFELGLLGTEGGALRLGLLEVLKRERGRVRWSRLDLVWNQCGAHAGC